MEWTDVIQDRHGKAQERCKHGQSHFKVSGPVGIPEKPVRKLMTRFPLEISAIMVLKSFKNFYRSKSGMIWTSSSAQ
ncbi:MAG: hypothetical protein PVH87_09620 [Desulfobacteraceae bacterium]